MALWAIKSNSMIAFQMIFYVWKPNTILQYMYFVYTPDPLIDRTTPDITK